MTDTIFLKTMTISWMVFFTLPLQGKDLLHGWVTDAENNVPLEAVLISVLRDGVTIDYTLTDTDGRYTLPWKYTDSIEVCASLLGYGREARCVNSSGQLDFALHTESILLKEVTIRPGRISTRKDTVRYNLADFATDKDMYVKDVLKRLPGIDVKENGTVTYKGKAIDHFLVEGMDVTGGRYNQVNNNLDARAVKSAELMENYQSMRTLKGKADSEEVALNLKLDEHARDQWFFNLQAGNGVTTDDDGEPTPLWEGGINALQLGKGQQSIFNVKTNNRGIGLSSEQEVLAVSGQDGTTSLPALIDQPAIQTPLDLQRLLFNETYTANANRIYRRSDERTLRLQADYTHDYRNQQRGNTQLFYPSGDTLRMDEAADYRLTTDNVHIGLAYEDNRATHYLTDRLNLEGKRNRSTASALGQQMETSHIRMHNRLDYLRSVENHTWEAHSSVQLLYQPSTLQWADQRNDHSQRSLSAEQTVGYLYKRNGFTRKLHAGISAEWADYELETQTGTRPYNASHLSADLAPHLQWERKDILASAELPVSWIYYPGARRSYFLYQPRLYFRYRYDYRWKFSLYAGISRSAGNALDLCPYLWRTDYRTMTTTAGLMPLSTAATGQLYAEYKHTVQEFFATATLTYTYGWHNTLQEQYLSTDTLAVSRRAQDNTTETWTLSATLSKGIFDWRMKASADLQLTSHTGEQLTRTATSSEAMLQRYHYRALRIEPKLIWSPASWLEATYHATLCFNVTRIDDTSLAALFDAIQRLHLTFCFGKEVEARISGEYYRNALGDGTCLHTFLADFIVSWRRGHWRLEAGLHNLFDKELYAYTTYTSTQSRTDWLRIRPRELSVQIQYRF